MQCTAGHQGASVPLHPLFTIGHSTRPIEEFIAVLQGHGVTRLIDVRTVPRSRHNPQFESAALAAALAPAGIGYHHEPGLGGFRKPRVDSINSGWRNASFRGYADYMQTPEFAAHLNQVIALAQHDTLALMCSEAVPWRCHRSLIADALLARGIPSADLSTPSRATPHKLTRFAQVIDGQVTYPPEQGILE